VLAKDDGTRGVIVMHGGVTMQSLSGIAYLDELSATNIRVHECVKLTWVYLRKNSMHGEE
jgi:hypothetical protein